MPLITVVAPTHPEELDLLKEIADAVAQTLDLADGDVIATTLPLRAFAVNGRAGGTAGHPWTLISIHGSDRETEKVQRARDAARSAAADWNRRHHVDSGGVWCEWLLPQYP